MVDGEGQLKLGMFMRRCMESKKKKTVASSWDSSSAGAEGGAPAETVNDPVDYEVCFETVIPIIKFRSHANA